LCFQNTVIFSLSQSPEKTPAVNPRFFRAMLRKPSTPKKMSQALKEVPLVFWA
jgi:hypothetical protein